MDASLGSERLDRHQVSVSRFPANRQKFVCPSWDADDMTLHFVIVLRISRIAEIGHLLATAAQSFIKNRQQLTRMTETGTSPRFSAPLRASA